MLIKKFNVLIRNRTRDLPDFSALPETNCATARPDAVQGVCKMHGKFLGVSLPPQNKERILYQYLPANT